MKFMKLGSKPDTFQADGKSISASKKFSSGFLKLHANEPTEYLYVSSELLTDVTINVGEAKFYLHKFPLLSKSNCLQKLVSKANEENCDEITMGDFPGGPKAFEICAKFCYGMTVTLNAYNVVAVRCAAEYLEMTEDIDRGNLIFKIEVFLNSSIFRSWKDSIIVLQTAKSLLPWSEDLKIVGRCIDSIASKTSVDPANITWSYTYNRKLSVSDRKAEDGMKLSQRIQSVPKDWWVEDVSELEIDVYKRVIIAVKSKGRMDSTVIGEALETYAVRWLPELYDDLGADTRLWRYKYIVETLVCLLPSDMHFGCTCGFLLKLLRFAILVGVDDTHRENLVDRISVKLHEASVKDLLIPAQSPQTTLYDVELVQCFVNRNVMTEKYVHCLTIENSEETEDFVLGPERGSLLDVGRLIDGYLVEIAHDPNLSLSSFMDLSTSIPDSARTIHDGFYKAINIFLQEHPNLTKSERKKVCGLIDVKRLTTDACMHAAQNELLPLRVIVQVLFFEQLRVAALNKNAHNASNTTNTDEEWEKAAVDDCKSLEKQLSHVKINDEEVTKNAKLTKKSSKNHRSGIQLLPSRSRRIFDKLWAVGKGNGENRSSETSGSSQSPTSMIPGDTKSSGSSSRHRRYSIS